jgi:hypothetical protein
VGGTRADYCNNSSNSGPTHHAHSRRAQTLNEAFPSEDSGQGNFQEISASATAHHGFMEGNASGHGDGISGASYISADGVCRQSHRSPYVNIHSKFTISELDWGVIGLDRSVIESHHSRSFEEPMVALQQIIAEAGIDIKTGKPIESSG